jgi:methylenetetrahydrofolate dehydrogenase (NADP+) / methenyltetrahydrofolate cyclohydrolase
MNKKILDGKALSKTLLNALSVQVKKVSSQRNRAPCLAVILVGQDPASEIYVRHKRTACQTVGILSQSFDFHESISEQELLKSIETLNNDQNVDGILVQLPLPEHIDTTKVIEHISPYKDVDGFHPYNLGRLAQKIPTLRPCTPMGVMSLLESKSIDVSGLNATVVGASNIVGRPMMLELLMAGATVTICHQKTKNLQEKVQQADLLVVAVGKPNFIPHEWIKPNAIVVDVGINRRSDGTLTGDVDFEGALEKVSFITPVPGGVGPMTIVSLLQNTLIAYEITNPA